MKNQIVFLFAFLELVLSSQIFIAQVYKHS